MKSTGMLRKIDELGRIVIPAEIRQSLGFEIKDPIEIYVDGDMVILKKYQKSCIFCDETENITDFAQKPVCSACLEKLKAL